MSIRELTHPIIASEDIEGSVGRNYTVSHASCGSAAPGLVGELRPAFGCQVKSVEVVEEFFCGEQ